MPLINSNVATVLTACGIETHMILTLMLIIKVLQQCLPLAVCDEGCEAAEEQSDDEARTSLVPDRREGKTKVMKQQCLPLAVLKPLMIGIYFLRW